MTKLFPKTSLANLIKFLEQKVYLWKSDWGHIVLCSTADLPLALGSSHYFVIVCRPSGWTEWYS